MTENASEMASIVEKQEERTERALLCLFFSVMSMIIAVMGDIVSWSPVRGTAVVGHITISIGLILFGGLVLVAGFSLVFHAMDTDKILAKALEPGAETTSPRSTIEGSVAAPVVTTARVSSGGAKPDIA